MSPDQVVRAWKDADYNACIGNDASASVPAHPIGPIDITDRALDVSGASIAIRTEYVETLGCCQGFTQAGKCDFTVGYPYCTVACLTIVLTNASLC
jgi:mersacidin/lichenicidin family type 2 lantibiotic